MHDSMLHKLEKLRERLIEIQETLVDSDTVKDIVKYTQLNKEFSDLKPIVEKFEEYNETITRIQGANSLLASEDDEITVHSSTQHPSEVQHKVADALGFGMHQVRVEVRRMGGGFGGKESQANGLAIACAVAAMETDRPCKMRYDRDDDFIITGKRHEFKIEYEVGFDEKGKINYGDREVDSIFYQNEDKNKPFYSVYLEDYVDIGVFGIEEEEESEDSSSEEDLSKRERKKIWKKEL